jgi:hypothetical protein
MILDSRNEFADAVSLNTGAAGTYLIGSQIDLTTVAGGLGYGDQLYLVVSVDTGINAASAGTVQFQLASDDSASIATDGTATILASSPALVTSTTSGNAGGSLAAGKTLWVVELPIVPEAERYLGIRQVTGTAAISAGKINAFLTTDVAAIKHYADAVN